jgi:SAM-dependent methyltransferase
MERDEYRIMYEAEDWYWWHVGLRDLVFSSISRYAPGEGRPRLLDAGCGTGGMLARCGGFDAVGLEASDEALQYCNKRGLQNVVRGSVCDMPFEDGSFDVVVSLDVLYHLDVQNETDALSEMHRVLKSGGILIVNLPAYEFLRGPHDRAIHTRRRYTAGELRKMVARAGLGIVRMTYRNTMLFPLALVRRVIQKAFDSRGGAARSDIKAHPDFLNALLRRVLLMENRLLSVVDLPFGLSVYCVLKKG